MRSTEETILDQMRDDQGRLWTGMCSALGIYALIGATLVFAYHILPWILTHGGPK